MAAKKDTTPKTVGPASDKKAALETALAQIEKQFGKGAVMKLGANVTMQVDAIPTGSLGLDLALGIGGVPRGRIVEVYGPESSGKTTLALQVLAEAQKMGGEVAFIDVEHALDPDLCRARWAWTSTACWSASPTPASRPWKSAKRWSAPARSTLLSSTRSPRWCPSAEIEGEMGDSHVGLQARLMSQALRKLTGVIGKTNTVCIFINQLREKVGRGLRQPRSHHRRPRAEILLQRAHRRAPYRGPEGLHRRIHRQPHPRQDRQEQGRAPVP